MLCLSLTGNDCRTCLTQFQNHRESVELLELRIDCHEEIMIEDISWFLESVTLPVILTCRRTKDGGKYAGSEKARLQLLEELMDLDFRYVELEEDVRRPDLEQKAADRSIRVIRSSYDLVGIPDDLYLRLVKLRRRGDIAKVAVTANSLDDLLKLFRVEEELHDIPEKVVIALGEYGIPARILYRRTGSLYTCCLPHGADEAAGHLSPEILRDLYHADRVNGNTRIFGIIGNPVMHTSSPKIHNPAFDQLGINAVYVPFLVDDIRAFFQLADILDIKGFSVTVPFKQQVLPYLGKISREVKLIGSCNTVYKKNDLWQGVNTDFYGFLSPLQEELEAQRIRKALVIGAGGAARSVVWALRNYYCKVCIVNRTPEKAEKLAGETGSSWKPVSQLDTITDVDLVVQTTSGGMTPYEEVDPSLGYAFTGREIAYDLVYKPKHTRFLKRAGSAGCRQVFGMEMLLAQGVLQFESFTGFTYPQKD